MLDKDIKCCIRTIYTTWQLVSSKVFTGYVARGCESASWHERRTQGLGPWVRGWHSQSTMREYYELKDAFSKTFVIKRVLYPKILCTSSSELLYNYVLCSNLN